MSRSTSNAEPVSPSPEPTHDDALLGSCWEWDETDVSANESSTVLRLVTDASIESPRR